MDSNFKEDKLKNAVKEIEILYFSGMNCREAIQQVKEKYKVE